MSLETPLSEGERRFICGGIDSGIRSDGRDTYDYEITSVERDVTHNCDGSAHVRRGNNDVLVGVKLQIEDVSKDNDYNGCGRIDFFADVTANASPQFEGRHGEDIANDIVSLFDASFPQFIDLNSLIIIEGKYFWVFHVDIVILECGSRASLIDTVAIAVKSALFDTKIPKVTVNTESNEFTICDDIFESKSIDVQKLPLFVTFTRIGSRYVIDVTREEESAGISSVTFAVNSDGIVYMKKFGAGSLHHDPIKDLFEDSKRIGISLNRDLMNKLAIEPHTDRRGKIAFSLY